uniref:Peptidase M12B domain-containing protein n=1 Tax=Caenorhabditis tropicalis TaxID=1561998 RepID=A0A1I7V3K8_9PELO
MTDTLDIKLSRQWSPVQCPISLEVNGHVQTPQSLVQLALKNTKFDLLITTSDGQNVYIPFEEDRQLFTPDIAANPSTSSLISHCHFESVTENGRHALSLCNSKYITGFFVTQDNRFGLSTSSSGNSFVLTPYVENNCDLGSLVSSSRKKRQAGKQNTVIDRNPSYIREHLDGRKRFVELALVADYSVYTKYDSDEKKLNDYIQQTMNILNSLYFPLNIRITLVHSEIWKKGDQISVLADSKETLNNFMEYKKLMLKDHLFDTGYLLTTLKFDDGVVGKAYKGTMCSYDYSGGIYVDHNNDTVETVATFAHELGHTFGMDHDPNDKDVCYCPMPRCIMNPQSGHMEVWSECSVKNLASGFNRGIDLCLFNEPGKKPSDAKCGNGIVEPGEECDCGPLKCDNDCCNGSTCKLIGEAQCASGDCCDLKTCKPKSRATVCRAAIGICDLDEFCNGETNDCPADFFVQNGETCPGRESEFCYEGGCGSRNDQCSKLWGPTGRNGDDNCYRKNTEGSFHGNCGTNAHTKEIKKCEPENTRCGLLQCETQAERPVFGDPGSVTFSHSTVYSSLKRDDKKFCYVFKSAYGGMNAPDPGLVPDGAICGEEQMCIGQKCQKKEKITKVTAQCLDNCNFRGVCNNVGNCHCERGFGGIACEIPGYGGSVNSNEAYRFRGWWSVLKKKFDLHGDLVPVRKAPPPPYAQRIRQSFTAMWGEDHSHVVVAESAHPRNCYNSCCRQPPRFDPPSIPMVTLKNPNLASPTPLLTANEKDQNSEKRDFYPDDSRSASAASFNTRTGSLRPNVQPPPVPRPSDDVLSKLNKDLENERKTKPEQLSKPLPPPLPKEKPKIGTSLKRNESMSQRPEQAPPPPPAHAKPRPQLEPPPKNIASNGSNNTSTEEKVDVRSMAAMFNTKLNK